MPSLPVDLNRDRLHDVSVPGSFETTGSFEVELRNRGEAVHVHLHLDDDLSRVATLAEGNHYVSGGDALAVPVRVRRIDETVTGRLKVVTAYGAETAHVSVTVRPDDPPKRTVDVDESLSKPPSQDPPRSEGFDLDVLPVSAATIAAALVSLVVLLAVGVFVEQVLLVLVAGIVIGGAVVAYVTRE